MIVAIVALLSLILGTGVAIVVALSVVIAKLNDITTMNRPGNPGGS